MEPEGRKVKCILCDGAGKRLVRRARFGGVPKMETCSDCNGDGFIVVPVIKL